MAAHTLTKPGNDHRPGHHHQNHGLALLPPPSDDPRDPLRWPKWIKVAALAATALANFTANFAATGLSVAAMDVAAKYDKSAHDVNALMSFNVLFLGVGNLVWVPLAVKFGKRFSMLTSMAMLFAFLVWTPKANSFNALFAARCLSGLAGGAGESLVPGIVSDIFFLHERAAMMAGYVLLAAGATAVGPLIASIMVRYSPNGYIDWMWVSAALAGFNLVMIFLFYPESNYHRPDTDGAPLALPPQSAKPEASEIEDANETTQSSDIQTDYVVEKPLTNVWTSYITVDHSVSFFRICIRPLILLLCPDVLFATLLYGVTLAAQLVLMFSLPYVVMAPPYLFSAVDVGLIQIAAIVGFLIGCFAGGYIADIITARVILRHKRVYPEQRLVSLIPGFLIPPVGCIVIAFACSRQLSWVAIAFGYGMVSFGAIYGPNIAITYVVESRPKQASEAIVTINMFKNLVSFLFIYEAVDWVGSRGWLEVYMIMFMLVSLVMLLGVPFYFFGSKLKAMSSGLEGFL